MEDKTPPETTPPPAARTAQALRELHDRARNALAAQRARMSQLEVQLTQQLDTIAGTVAEQIASDGGPSDSSQQASQEFEQLRQELDKARAAWQTEREQLEAQVAEQSQLLALKQAELDAANAQLGTGQNNADSRQQALDDRTSELNHRERELCQRQELLDAYAEQCAAQQSELTATESALDKQRTVITEREAAIESSQAQFDRDRSELAAREQTWQNGQAELDTQRAALNAERDAMNEQLTKATKTNQVQDEELEAQLGVVQRQLVDERTAWERERTSVEEQRRLLAKDRDELATALDAARNELAAARELAGAAAERDELQQKFGLALQDVQRLRGRVAELEQDLSSRPAADQTESVELVHLRAERDAMAERITELERRPATPDDGDASQERADLQRRFELAVEDVRDLKKKNALLDAQLAAAAANGVPVASAAGGSWEATKLRMLASLEDEGDDVGEERREEWATIESTIRITDEAMALKDREIADLKMRLAEGLAVADDNHAMRELVDADTVIAEHRARTAQLEEEMKEKLRAAELEVSVERAKLARENAHLADLKAEIESQRATGYTPTAPGAVQHPKRRWLSKLGLSGDEEK